LIFASVIGTSRSTGVAKEYRFRLWSAWTPTGRQLTDRLRGLEPVPPEDVGPLQTAARALVQQRWVLLLTLGSCIAQVGGVLGGQRGSTWLVLVGCFIAFMTLASVQIEHQARVGATFLARYPLSGPRPGPDQAHPGSV
jgi:hypothetical protein